MPGAIAGFAYAVCEMCLRIWQMPKSAHNLANFKASPPLAVMPMLGLTPTPRQASGQREIYDFSLSALDSSILSGC
jgi:hypothetical protein